MKCKVFKIFTCVVCAASTSPPSLAVAQNGGSATMLVVGMLAFFSRTHKGAGLGQGGHAWEKKLNVSVDARDGSVAFLGDGSYVAGATFLDEASQNSSLLVQKSNATDALAWRYTFYHSGQDRLEDLTIGHNDTIAILANTYASALPAPFVTALNSEGNVLWSRGLNLSHRCEGKAIEAKPEGGYMVTGYFFNVSSGRNAFVADLNQTGHTQWITFFGGQQDDEKMALIPTGNGSILTGYTMSYAASGVDLWITGLSPSGAITWSYALHQGSHTYGQGVVQRANGTFMVTGYVDAEDRLDMFIGEFTANGSLHTWHLIDEKEPTQGLAITSYGGDAPSILGASYTNATQKGGIFMLQWQPNDTFSMRRWDHEEQVQPLDITSYGEARLIVATQQDPDMPYAQLLLLKSSARLFDACGTIAIPSLHNLTHNITQTEVFPTVFFPNYTSYEAALIHAPFDFSEVIRCEEPPLANTTTPPPTPHPTTKPTRDEFNGFGEKKRAFTQDILIFFLCFMGYAIGVPIMNRCWEEYKAKKRRDRQEQPQTYLFRKTKTLGPL